MSTAQNTALINRLIILCGLLLILTCAACSSPIQPQPATDTAARPPVIDQSTAVPSLSPSVTPSPLPVPTLTPSPTISPTPTPSITPIPTYLILRGEVLLRSNCRYGPGAPYLYKYGLVAGSNLEVIGRNDLGTWILVRAIGGNNPCWVKASLMQLKGDVMSVEPTYIPLPQSPYYGPPKDVSAIRDGDVVTLFWSPVQLRAGDDSGQFPYLVEAWVCQGGTLQFVPLGTYDTAIEILDERGCSQPSHARLYAVEKHGYSRWIKIPWPAP